MRNCGQWPPRAEDVRCDHWVAPAHAEIEGAPSDERQPRSGPDRLRAAASLATMAGDWWLRPPRRALQRDTTIT